MDLKKEPLSYAETCAWPDTAVWCAVIDREVASLRDIGAFQECELPSGKKALSLKWVYTIKINMDGQRIAGKEKAWVVALGFCQWLEDFSETAAL